MVLSLVSSLFATGGSLHVCGSVGYWYFWGKSDQLASLPPEVCVSPGTLKSDSAGVRAMSRWWSPTGHCVARKEMAFLAWAPDAPAAEMASALRAGMDAIVDGFAHLADDPDRAGSAADVAVGYARAVEHTYRSAMAGLASEADLRAVFTSRELYRAYGRSAGLVAAVTDRLWYAVLSAT